MKRVPISDNLVMLTTVVIVVSTHNLAYGVVGGTLLSAIFFGIKSSKVHVNKIDRDGVVYIITGQLSFASCSDFIQSFDYQEKVKEVTIDFTNVRLWDESAVDAVDKVVIRLHKNGIKTHLIGLSPSCERLLEKCAIHNKPGGLEVISGH